MVRPPCPIGCLVQPSTVAQHIKSCLGQTLSEDTQSYTIARQVSALVSLLYLSKLCLDYA